MRRFLNLLPLAFALLLFTGCPEDDDDVADDDTYTGITESTINLNVYTPGAEPGEPEIALISYFTGEQVIDCGPATGSDVVPFNLVSAPDLTATDGQLVVHADGWLTDTAVNPSQSLNAPENGGTFEVYLPTETEDPYGWVAGVCYLFIHSQPEDCFDNPDIPYCGELSCGSEEEPMQNSAGDLVWMRGTFNCYK